MVLTILAVELDTGPLFVGPATVMLGVDAVCGAMINEPAIAADGASLELIADALPEEAIGAWWVGRAAALVEVEASAGSVYDGRIVFDGQIAQQPHDTAGLWSVTLVPFAARVVEIPSAAPVDVATWPKASSDAMGMVPPVVVGTVDECPLLAVDEPLSTTLADAVSPGAVAVTLDSVTGLPAFGAVWIGDEAIHYNGVSGSQLVGLTVREYHPKGSPVVLAGPAQYLPAEHSVGVEAVTSNGQPIAGYALADGLLQFPRRPLVEAVGQAMTVLVQFDQVATGAWAVAYDVAYDAGRTIAAPVGTEVTTAAAESAAVSTVAVGSAALNAVGTITGLAIGVAANGSDTVTTWTATVALSGSVAVPSGAAVTVKSAVERAGITVGGQPLRTTTVVASSGSIAVAGSLTVVVTYSRPTVGPASQPLSDAATVAEVSRALAQGNTIAQAKQIIGEARRRFGVTTLARAHPWNQVQALDPVLPVLTLSWKTTAEGDVLGLAPAVSQATAARETQSVPTLADLARVLTPPASITSGSFVFAVEVQAQLRQDITNPAPVYTATLGGVAFALPKAGGTVNVTVPVTAGVPVALVHTVSHPTVDLQAVAIDLFGGRLAGDDLAAASAITLICPRITRLGVTWSSGAITSPALNAVNAIRAVTATVEQSAASIDAAIASEGKGYIRFSRPNSDRIISGTYQVAYTVAANGYAGPLGIRIGSEWVYYADGGVSVYAWSPATVTLDDDVDLLPVEVVGGAGVVAVTITAATRLVLTGNIDGNKYATLRHPSNINWRAVQTDVVPRRGRLKKARLAVEWFMGGNKGTATPDVQVRFGGVLRGSLRLEAPAGATTSKTITVDITSQGSASLPSQSISSTLQGAVGQLSHSIQAFTSKAQPPTVLMSMGGGLYQGITPCDTFIGWDSGLGAITCQLCYQATSQANASSYAATELVEFLDAAGGTISATSGSWSVVVSGQLYQLSYTFTTAPTYVRFRNLAGSTNLYLTSVKFLWNGKVTANAVSQANNLSGVTTSNPFASPKSLNNSGIAATTNNGSFTITVPDAPRTTVTEFELPDVTDWPDLTGKVCEINYTAGVSTLDINLVQVQIAVEYEEANQTAIGGQYPLIATLHGTSGNPADVIQSMGEAIGERFDAQALSRLRGWCSVHDYGFARRISEPTDALTLLTYASQQAMVQLARRLDGRIAPVRWFDLGSAVVDISERDLIEPARIGWADRVENRITLNYREAADGGTRTLTASSTNNAHCRAGLKAMRRENKVALDAFWIRSDGTATQYLAAYARRYARPRRVLSLALPFDRRIEAGDLIRYLPLNQPDDRAIFARITTVSLDAGWPVVEAEEVLN